MSGPPGENGPAARRQVIKETNGGHRKGVDHAAIQNGEETNALQERNVKSRSVILRNIVQVIEGNIQ